MRADSNDSDLLNEVTRSSESGSLVTLEARLTIGRDGAIVKQHCDWLRPVLERCDVMRTRDVLTSTVSGSSIVNQSELLRSIVFVLDSNSQEM